MAARPVSALVIGAGVAGLTAAFELARRGARVDLYERREGPGLGCSWFAGGMIAPWCERESAEQAVLDWGLEGLAFWTRTFPVASRTGSLVVAPPRDRPEVVRFSRRTSHFETLDARGIAALEPDLESRFPFGLHFPDEAMLAPREATTKLALALGEMSNVRLHFSTEAPDGAGYDWTLDCTGFAAKGRLAGLRGVKGEMLVLASDELSFSRPLRLIHPRRPVYVVPRGDGIFMVGATMIESETPGRVTALGLMELLGSAYALHPAFGEAQVLESGADVRPAFADHLPRLRVEGRRLWLNGLYRHGFLLSPALARRAADIVVKGERFPEFDR